MSGKKNFFDCPVCKDVQLQKISPSVELELMLDYCDVCGGMWFESGEVRQLRLCSPEVLSGLITMKKQLHTVECSSCGNGMTRNAAECKSCGHDNTINCPSCSAELERVQSEVFTVDVCRECRGVWFDNMDLSAVWNLQFDGPAHAAAEGGSSGDDEKIDTEDTVLAVLRHGEKSEFGEDGDGKNVFGAIADIIGGIFTPSA